MKKFVLSCLIALPLATLLVQDASAWGFNIRGSASANLSFNWRGPCSWGYPVPPPAYGYYPWAPAWAPVPAFSPPPGPAIFAPVPPPGPWAYWGGQPGSSFGAPMAEFDQPYFDAGWPSNPEYNLEQAPMPRGVPAGYQMDWDNNQASSGYLFPSWDMANQYQLSNYWMGQ